MKTKKFLTKTLLLVSLLLGKQKGHLVVSFFCVLKQVSFALAAADRQKESCRFLS